MFVHYQFHAYIYTSVVILLSLVQIQKEIGYADAQTLRQPIPRAHPQHPHNLAQSAAHSSASHPQCSGARAEGLLQAWLPCNTCRTQDGTLILKGSKTQNSQRRKATTKGKQRKAKGKRQKAKGKTRRYIANGHNAEQGNVADCTMHCVCMQDNIADQQMPAVLGKIEAQTNSAAVCWSSLTLQQGFWSGFV